MRFSDLIKDVQCLEVNWDDSREIKGVAYDSRRVEQGFLFVALPGIKSDGAKFIGEAVSRGAVGVVAQTAVAVPPGVVYVRVESARRALAELAAKFYNWPARELQVVGVTGTSGKTTTAYLVQHLLGKSNCGMIGTVVYDTLARRQEAERTSPESAELQALFREIVMAGGKSVVMEVSSHALSQRRVDCIDFDVGVFTNLSREHLDYHITLENYCAAKAQLFRGLGTLAKKSTAVYNDDDPWSKSVAAHVGPQVRHLSFGFKPTAAVRAEELVLSLSASSFKLITPWGATRVELPLLGRFNVYNALAACAAGGALGLTPAAMAEQLSLFRSVPGRLERIANDRGVHVFVDYAHKPDALENVLKTLREVVPARILLVFGCGGERDVGKRPLMGAIAAKLADYTILTSDNPRDEDAEAIVQDIREGFRTSTNYETLLDRREALSKVLRLARPGDVVVVAGKGHENYQLIGGRKLPFDDAAILRQLLA